MVIDIVIPTYDEAENLRKLIPRIFSVFSSGRIRANVIVVDDSPDKQTSNVVLELQRTYPALQVLHSDQRLGLAQSVIKGFHASDAEILCVMDADLSHPPESIPMLIQALEQHEADIVIASRYCSGGQIEGWGMKRLVISRMATWIARGLVPNVKDPLSGFFVLRRRILEEASLDPLGFKIGLEILVKARGAKVIEIPFTFADRQIGYSKLTLREEVNFLRHIVRLLLFKLRSTQR